LILKLYLSFNYFPCIFEIMSSWKNDMMEVKHTHSIFSPLCLGNNCKINKN